MQLACSASVICLHVLQRQQKYKSGEFYQNKLTLAHYFVQRILPELSMRIAKINAGSDLVMEFSEESFTSQS